MPRSLTKIDSIDRKLIVILARNSRISTTAAAKIIKRSREFTDYRIKKLIKEGYFEKFTISVSNSKLGFQTYQILIKLQNYDVEQYKKLVNYLKSSKYTKIVERCNGGWDILVKPVFKSRYGLIRFIDSLDAKFGEIINNHEILLDHIPLKHEDLFCISDLKFKEEEFVRTSAPKIDNIDRKILNYLAEDSRISLSDLAKKSKISLDTCIRRFKVLVNKKVISSFKSTVNFEKFDSQFYYLFLRVKNFDRERRTKIQKLFKEERNIVYAGRVIGNWDMFVQITAKNQKEFDNQMMNLISHLKNDIKDYSFAIIVDKVKKETYPKSMR
jgi:DNA-binding Lrp family transcriptional regulator